MDTHSRQKNSIIEPHIQLCEWIQKRNEEKGSLSLVQNELRLKDEVSYRNYLRLDEEMFEELLTRITPRIQRKDTVMRMAITARQRLQVTLRFLASGNSYTDLAYAVRIPCNTISLIIPDTMSAIVAELENECIKWPNSEKEWEGIDESFSLFWNTPYCEGAIDGKHVAFRPSKAKGGGVGSCSDRLLPPHSRVYTAA